ncbi:MAG: hypothetical protein M3Q14_04220 [bacterium]|nr:hypothetical protein [bacterium]
MLLPGETIVADFQPALSDVASQARYDAFINCWRFMNQSLAAPTFADSGLKAAVWLPDQKIQVKTISDVPVLAVSIPKDEIRIRNNAMIWYAGALPLNVLKEHSREDIELARLAIETAHVGGSILSETLGYLATEFGVQYIEEKK